MPVGQRLGVGDHLLLIGDEFRLHRFEEADGLGRHHVHQRTALRAGEYRLVDRRAVLLLRQNDAGARSAQSLVRGGSDDIGVLAGIRMQTRGHQSGEMRHVDQQNRADRIGRSRGSARNPSVRG